MGKTLLRVAAVLIVVSVVVAAQGPGVGAVPAPTPVRFCVGAGTVRVAATCTSQETAIPIASSADLTATVADVNDVEDVRWQAEHLRPRLSWWTENLATGPYVLEGYGLKPNTSYGINTGIMCPFSSDEQGRVDVTLTVDADGNADCFQAFNGVDGSYVYDLSQTDYGQVSPGGASRIYNEFGVEITQLVHCETGDPMRPSHPCVDTDGDTTAALQAPPSSVTAIDTQTVPAPVRICVSSKGAVTAPAKACPKNTTTQLLGAAVAGVNNQVAPQPFRMCVNASGAVTAPNGACPKKTTATFLATQGQLDALNANVTTQRQAQRAWELAHPRWVVITATFSNVISFGWGLGPVENRTFSSGLCTVGYGVSTAGHPYYYSEGCDLEASTECPDPEVFRRDSWTDTCPPPITGQNGLPIETEAVVSQYYGGPVVNYSVGAIFGLLGAFSDFE